MQKNRLLLLAFGMHLVCIYTTLQAQQAADYFPSSPSVVWTFNESVLDSLQQKIDGLTVSARTIFNGDRMVDSRTAHCLTTDPGIVQTLPIAETTYVATSGSIGSIFFDTWPAAIGGDIIGASALAGIIRSFRGWYDIYRFAAPIGVSSTIFSKDTSITINTTSVPLRFWATVARLSDQTVSVPAGIFAGAKRFVVTFKLSVVYIPMFPIDLVAFPDTTWISASRWIVRETTPTQHIDLSLIGGGSYNIPGTSRELVAFGPSTGIRSITTTPLLPSTISMAAWPNPFNPEVTIEVRLANSGATTIVVVDILGRVTERLFDGNLDEGSHRFHWQATTEAAGTYYVNVTQRSRSAVSAVHLLK